MRRTATILLVLALLVTPLPVAAAEEPRFETYVPEPTLRTGGTTDLTVQLVNDASDPGDRVETARNVKATVVSGDTPFEIKSGTRLVGSMADGDTRAITVQLSVPANISAGTYRVPIRLKYENDNNHEQQTVYATVRIEERARFVVESTNASVPVGSRGDVAVTLTNVGERPATDASVVLESSSPDIRFGGTNSASRFVGRWAPNETKTIVYEATVAETADARNYTLNARVTYENTDGIEAASRSLPLGLTPLPEQSFDVRNVESTLRVGEDGTLNGTLVNTGPTTVENAVVVFNPSSPTVHTTETEYAVGTLKPGEKVAFGFDVEVTDDAKAGPRQFSMRVTYRRNDDQYRSDPIDVKAAVATSRPTFEVTTKQATFAAGTSGTRLELMVTNAGEKPLRDISAKLYTETPLSSSDDEAFVSRLEPGESATLVFGFGVGGGALAKTYPVKLDFRYDDPEGDTHISDTYQVPVQVTRQQGGGPSLPIVIGGLVLVALLAGGYLYSRR